MINRISNLIYVLLLLFISTEVLAANYGQTYIGKIELKESGTYDFSQFGNVFFVDNQSLESKGLHDCDSNLRVVSTNDLFFNKENGTEADVTIGLKFSGDKNIFRHNKVRLEGRDYFSGAAILTLDDTSAMEKLNSVNHQFKCIGLNSTSPASSVLGFPFFSLETQIWTLQNALDRGLSGALSVDTKNTPTGFLTSEYWSLKNGKSKVWHSQNLDKVSNYLKRIFRKQTESSKGALVYYPQEELIVFRGGKDAAVLEPEGHTTSGRVLVLGAPEEIFVSQDLTTEYSRRSRDNGFSGLKYMVGPKAVITLKAIDGVMTPTWAEAESLLMELPERSNPTFRLTVNATLGSIDFLVGNRYVELLSLMRWIQKSGLAIKDKFKTGNPRSLNSDELEAMNSLLLPMNVLFEKFAQQDDLKLIEGGSKLALEYFRELQDEIQKMKKVFFSKDEWGRFNNKQITMYAIQGWVLELEKWVGVQRSALARPTIQNQE